MEKITIKIQPGGKYQVETTGFVGKSCEQATDGVLKRLGGHTETEKKPDYFRRDPKVGQQQTLGN